MIGWASSRRLHWAALLATLVLAPACFRGADATKIVCGDDDHCPSGYQCRVDPNTRQGRCERRASADAPTDAPAGFDAPVGGGGTPATGGTAGSGQGGTRTISGRGGAGGAATDAGLGSGGGAGGTPGYGGDALGTGGTQPQTATGSGGNGATGGAAGRSSQMGTGGQGLAGGSGGSGCPLPEQELCGTACIDPKTDSSNCGGCGKPCAVGQRCSGGGCVCDGTSCPHGCCSDNTCLELTAQSYDKCGKSGAACFSCTGDSYCVGGTCECPFSNRIACGDEICIDIQTSKSHCGTCSKTCKDGCSAGQCFTHLATVAEDEIRIAVNATDVYFVMSKAGTISWVSRSGGAVQLLVSSQPYPDSIALDSNNVYWLNEGLSYGTGSVMKLSLTGGEPVTLATSEAAPEAMAVDASNVYWVDYGDVGEGAIMKVPIAGGTKVQLASGDSVHYPYRIAVDSTDVYWVNVGSGPVADGSIMRIPKAGGPLVTVASGIQGGQDLVVMGGTVYFLSSLGLQSVSTSGGVVSTVKSLPPGGRQWLEMAADTDSIYMGGRGIDLVRLDLIGGGTTRLASDVSRIALDDNNVFWTTRTDINVTPKVP
jgi:hypothetical protein